MLSFDLQSLRTKAAHVSGELAPDDPVWREGDARPSGPVRVSGRISSAGPDRFYWHGRIEGGNVLPCRRCLADAHVALSEETHVIFSQAGDREDDPDVFELDPGMQELDLKPAVRELWLLHALTYPLCRDDCKGLCPTCGADLNAGPCGCPSQTDSRWDTLRKATGGSE
ncbi:MAG TPA: DUF177 domain-containing protein [Gemmatimonadaceae bacterium]|nr:DUF177 domain-containing protein [Gemmatimonadaceae bacterium]